MIGDGTGNYIVSITVAEMPAETTCNKRCEGLGVDYVAKEDISGAMRLLADQWDEGHPKE